MPTHAETTRATRWAGVSAADRVTGRRALLLDVALELLGTVGWVGTSVRAVCQQARLNPRYFYESFDNLDALLVGLFERLMDELRIEVAAEIEAAVARLGDHPPVRVRAMVAATVRYVDEDRRRARVLYLEASGNEVLSRHRLETGSLVAEEVSAARVGPEAEAVSRTTAAFLVGGFSELLVQWLDGRIDVSREQLVDDVTALFVALGGTAGRTAITRRPD